VADVPILRPGGEKPEQRTVAYPAGLSAVPHRIDENGLVGLAPEGVALPRSSYMDGEQLLAAIAGVVRHELVKVIHRECAVPGCEGEAVATLTIGLGDEADTLAVNVWLCEEHGEQADQAIGGAPDLTDEQRAIVDEMENQLREAGLEPPPLAGQ
jgi:hypothetical protein